MGQKAEFSETQFVFAFMSELVKIWADHVVECPEFPTQRKEGKIGGYDVRLESTRGFLYFAQFKTSEYCDSDKIDQADFGVPLYRYQLRTKREPNQHELLRNLELQGNLVEYVAPHFHTGEDLNRLYVQGDVCRSVRRVRPVQIGAIPPGESHFVVFELSGARPTLYSRPRSIEQPDYGFITADGFETVRASGEVDIREEVAAQRSRYPLGSLAQRLDSTSSMIASAFGVMSIANQMEDPYVRARTLSKLYLGSELLVVHDG